MTAKDAIDVIRGTTWLGGSEYGRKTKEALGEAKKALEKQIAKQPRLIRRAYIPETYDISYEMWECPCCEKTYYITEGYDEEFLYCSKCGQYLGDDWSEECE